jgi:AP2 domain
MNKPAAKQSKYRGVVWSKQKGKWHARFMINRKAKHLGFFVEEIKAALAYDAEARRVLGQFARLNFPTHEEIEACKSCKLDTIEKVLAAGPNAPQFCHGKCKHCSRLRGIWGTMIGRCHDQKRDSFERYGRRGIVVCGEWMKFSTFRLWALQTGYKAGLEIDRRKNDKGYSPDNCRWVTKNQQAFNKLKYRKNPQGGTPSSPFIGVTRDKARGKWMARIKENGRNHTVGRFDTQEEAAHARDGAAVDYHGEHASLNFNNS